MLEARHVSYAQLLHLLKETVSVPVALKTLTLTNNLTFVFIVEKELSTIQKKMFVKKLLSVQSMDHMMSSYKNVFALLINLIILALLVFHVNCQCFGVI